MSVLEQLDRTILLCRDFIVDGVSDEEICRRFRSMQVLCVSDRRNLSSHGGQTALFTLVSLLSRMGMQVGLSIPEIAVVAPQPPFSGLSVRDALVASSETLVSGAAVRFNSDFNPDIVFALGDTQFRSRSAECWRLTSNEWDGGLATLGQAEVPALTAEWSVGAMVSAALGANEAFKCVLRSLPLRCKSDRVFVEPSPFCNWSFGSLPVPNAGLNIGEVDIISAGAICQAALYALLRLPRVEMWGRIFDDDRTGESNLNRNMLTLLSDVEVGKVVVVARRCGPHVRLEPISHRFPGPTGVARLASRALVGVDDIPSRWAVQRHAHGWVGVSGTSHFSISSSAHRPTEPCCGCLHPIDEPTGANPIPTVSFVSFWAGLAMAVRLIGEALGSPYPSNRQHLWLTPLRPDQPRAAMWAPVAPRRDCPVGCSASQRL